MSPHTRAFVIALLAAGAGVVTPASAAPAAPPAPARTAKATPATPAPAPTALGNQPASKPSGADMVVRVPLHPRIRASSSIGFVKPTGGLSVQQLPKAFVVVKDFIGEAPVSGLTLHEGRMYGTTAANYNGPGAVFRYTPGKLASDMGTLDILRKFPDGGLSYGDLVVASSTDAVFGNTQRGGAYGGGFLFRIAKGGSYKVVHDYRRDDGVTWDTMPGAWMFTSADNLFGITQKAVTKKTPGDEIERRADLSEWTRTGVSVTRAANGSIFFSTFWGHCAMSTTPGDVGYGALLELRPEHSTVKCLHDADSLGRGSFGSLIALDEDTVVGTMEGDASTGKNGGIFKWKRGAGIKVLHVFDQETEGSWGKMIRGADGNYYGTTIKIWNAAGQVTASLGILWKMTPAGAFSTLHQFTCGADGCLPCGVAFHDGYLYGVTAKGGKYGVGGIFRYRLP